MRVPFFWDTLYILWSNSVNLNKHRQGNVFQTFSLTCDVRSVNISEMIAPPPPPPWTPLNESKSKIEIPSTLYNSAKGTRHHTNTVKIRMLPSTANIYLNIIFSIKNHIILLRYSTINVLN